MQTTTAPTAWGRLGYVLNWAGIAAGLWFGGIWAVAASPLGPVYKMIDARVEA